MNKSRHSLDEKQQSAEKSLFIRPSRQPSLPQLCENQSYTINAIMWN